MSIHYEWNVKLMDGEDIEDNAFTDFLRDSIIGLDEIDGKNFVLELIRNRTEGSKSDEYLVEREHTDVLKAPEGHWYLPLRSATDKKIPNSRHIELAAWQVER